MCELLNQYHCCAVDVRVCLYVALFAGDTLNGCFSVLEKKRYYFWTIGQRIVPTTKTDFVWKLTEGMMYLTYTNWSTPPSYSGGKEGCLHIIWPEEGGTWNDIRCDLKCCFVCETQ